MCGNHYDMVIITLHPPFGSENKHSRSKTSGGSIKTRAPSLPRDGISCIANLDGTRGWSINAHTHTQKQFFKLWHRGGAPKSLFLLLLLLLHAARPPI